MTVGTSSTLAMNTIVADGFNSNIALTANNQPAGVTVSFSPDSITGAGSSIMTMAVGWNVPAGIYYITVTGTSGNVSETSIVKLWVSTPVYPPSPTFNPPPGIYTSPQSVTISDPITSATIYYTTDSSWPTTSSAIYSAPIQVNSTETILALLVVPGYSQTVVSTEAYTINIPIPDYSVATSPTSSEVTSGQSATTTITVTPQNGFNSAVSFSCSGLPTGAVCNFSPQTVTPSGTAASTTLTITTSAASATSHANSRPVFPESALAVVLFCIGLKRRWHLHICLWIVTSAAGLSLLSGCGSGGASYVPPTTPQSVTSVISVTASAGSLSHSTNFFLTVQ